MAQGGCLCGEVRYEARGKALGANFCHCRTCQLASGAPLLAWVTFPTAGFRWTAAPPAIFASSEGVARRFCARCGTTLSWGSAKSPGSIDIATATLDDPTIAPPADHIWVRSRLPWMRCDDGLTEYPTGGGSGRQTPGRAAMAEHSTGTSACANGGRPASQTRVVPKARLLA